MSFCTIYTDAAHIHTALCAWYGVVVVSEGVVVATRSGAFNEPCKCPTEAEIKAMYNGFAVAKQLGFKRAKLFTDSQPAVDAFNKPWKKGTNRGQEWVDRKRVIRDSCQRKINKINKSVEWVKGHEDPSSSDHSKYNDMAHKLAEKAKRASIGTKKARQRARRNQQQG